MLLCISHESHHRLEDVRGGCVVLAGKVIPGSDLLSRSCVPNPVPHLSSPLLAAQRKHDDLKEKCELGHQVTLASGRALHSVFVSSS